MTTYQQDRRLLLLVALFLFGAGGLGFVLRRFNQANAHSLFVDPKETAAQSDEDTVASAESVTWRQKLPLTAPPERDLAAMAYDSSRNVSVLFGGRYETYGFFDDTWEWDGVNWTEQTPATWPSARPSHAMAFDSSRGRTVLFGGYAGSGPDSTWEWDGTDWLERYSPTMWCNLN